MAERTVTELAVDPSGIGRERRPEFGVVVAFCRGNLPWTALPVASSLTVGRDASADLVVDDAGVSRIHVRFENRGNSLYVTDLGSRNGTFVNGVSVPARGILAPPGSVVRVAKTLLVVQRDVSPFLEKPPPDVPGLVGGAALDDARVVIDTIARTNSPVLVLGETGTGKEVIASALHAVSGRRGEFVALNCAAVASELVDAELFGHSRGAFSGAVGSRAGLFRTADRGTLFLDEIGELPAPVQAKLLRVLETNQVRSVGEDRPIDVDVRIIAATNRDLDEMVDGGAFRGDLLHRVAGLRICLAPLRDRVEDIPALVVHFLAQEGLTPSAHALERLMLHSFSGNVRELRHMVRTAAEVARRHGHSEVAPGDVATVMGTPTTRQPAHSGEDELSARVAQTLTDCQGNVPEAAQRLGMSRSVLYETLRRLRLDPKSFRAR